MNDRTITERLAELMREAGYKARIIEDDLIESGTGGLKFQISTYSARSIQCWLGMAQIDADLFSDEQVNGFNRTMRFAKCYWRIDETGSRALLLEQDFLLEVIASDAQQRMDEILNVWTASVTNFSNALRKGNSSSDG